MKKPAKSIFILCGFFLAALAAFLFGTNILDPKISRLEQDSIKIRFDRLLSGEGSRIWTMQRALLQQQALHLIENESEAYRQKAFSPARLEEFTDEYFGYFKGFKFLYLGFRDAAGTEKNRIEDEIKEMLVKYIFFDLNDFQGNIQAGLESLMEVHLRKYSEKTIELLEENFSRNDFEAILTTEKVNSIPVAGSNIHSLVLTMLFLRGTNTMSAMPASTLSQKILSEFVLNPQALVTSTTACVPTTGLGILADYLFSHTAKHYYTATLENSLASVVDSVIRDNRQAAEKALLAVLEAFPAL